MTIEEAIEILRKNRPTSDPRPCGIELCDAVDMAISALREQETVSNRNETLTNAQKIRSMSDEELAELIDRETDSCAPTGDCEKMSRDCKACWLDWLQQPAEEADHENL